MPRLLSHKKLPDDALKLIAQRFKALSEHNRLKLIIALQDGEKNVGQLIEATGLKQANVSRHLQTLTDAGLLTRQRRGLEVIYSIADHGIFDMCHQVCGGIQKRLRNQARVFTG